MKNNKLQILTNGIIKENPILVLILGTCPFLAVTTQASNGAGYTFSITAQGYGGKNTLKMAVGVDMDGKITGTKVLSHKETVGLGSKITTDQRFIGDFLNKGADEIDGIDRISGATFSSNYDKAAIKDALAAFELVKG